MRILDKNADFYDYLQNVYRDSSTTFDRRNSFVLTKDRVCTEMRDPWHSHGDKYRFLLLQVCHTFWLFLAELEDMDQYETPKDYTMDLLASWKNYDSPRKLIDFNVIRPFSKTKSGYEHLGYGWRHDASAIRRGASDIVRAIDQKDYEISGNLGWCITRQFIKDKCVENKKDIPILIACGIAPYIDPLEIYLSFEEYFSLEKSSSERTASTGITDKEKIVNHGFNLKDSFRGKLK